MLHLKYGEFDMLFTGDISSEEETAVDGGIEVLKVPHHGSRYSTSAEWLAMLHPQTALISCGKDNRYGHPHEEVLERLEEAGIKYYITSEDKAVEITTDGSRYRIHKLFGESG